MADAGGDRGARGGRLMSAQPQSPQSAPLACSTPAPQSAPLPCAAPLQERRGYLADRLYMMLGGVRTLLRQVFVADMDARPTADPRVVTSFEQQAQAPQEGPHPSPAMPQRPPGMMDAGAAGRDQQVSAAAGWTTAPPMSRSSQRRRMQHYCIDTWGRCRLPNRTPDWPRCWEGRWTASCRRRQSSVAAPPCRSSTTRCTRWCPRPRPRLLPPACLSSHVFACVRCAPPPPGACAPPYPLTTELPSVPAGQGVAHSSRADAAEHQAADLLEVVVDYCAACLARQRRRTAGRL